MLSPRKKPCCTERDILQRGPPGRQRFPINARLPARHQFLEKRPVMNHGLAQIFGAGLPARLTKRASMRRAIIFDNQRMIHGDIRRALFKIADRIAAYGHHIAQQLVGIGHRAAGAIDEARLNSAPGLDKPCAIARAERPDVQSSPRVPRACRAPLRPAAGSHPLSRRGYTPGPQTDCVVSPFGAYERQARCQWLRISTGQQQ
jgi:hypothetical protein